MTNTSNYSKEAKEYMQQIEKRSVLIDGPQLVELMFQHNLGDTPVQSYEIKRTDQDFFKEL